MTKFQIIRDILALDNVTAQQKLMLIAMNQYGDEGSNIYPSLHSIAKVCALSYRQTKRHARTLRDRGYLVPTGKSRLNTVNYRMVIPSGPKVGTWAAPPKGSWRPSTTLNKIPSTNPLSGDFINDYQAGDGLSTLNPAGHETLVNLGVRKR
jgi:hypothetical protein